MTVVAVLAIFHAIASFAGQGASRMLYTAPNSTFIENPSGDSVVTINDTSGSIATLQTSINNARSANPNSIIVILLLNGGTYTVSSSSLVLGSQECLVGSGATIQAANPSVTVPLVQVTLGATNVSLAGGTFNGDGANINAIYGAGNNRVNVDKVTVLNCGSDCIQLNGNGSGTFDNELTVTRCDASGSPGHAGISIWNATQAVCVDNNCHNNSVGIWLGNCAYCIVANNTCETNTTGIDFNSGSNNYIANNTCNNNGMGILLDGSGSTTASDSLGGNSVAGIKSSGSGNVYADNLFTAGNFTNFINGGSGDDVVAYKGSLNASGQNYFYPPLIDSQHTNTIVNGRGRTDITNSATTTIDSVQSQYNAAFAANPGNVIVLHLNGAYTVGANPLTLSNDTCVLLGGTIQINSSTSASCAISATSSSYISISGGIIDGGTSTPPSKGRNGINFSSVGMFQIDAVTLQHFGANSTRVGGSDVIHVSGGSTPRIFTRCTINGGSARGIWMQSSGIRTLVSDNTITDVQMDGVDCDSSTSVSLVKFNTLTNDTRYGVFVEQSASYNCILGNICNYDSSYGVGCYNNSATPRGPTAYNSVICNSILGGGGLRNGSTGTNIVTSSDNFFFNNILASTSIHSDIYGTQDYYSQNYLSGTSLSTSASTVFFNSTDVSSNLFVQDSNSGLAVLVQGASTANGASVVIGPASGLGNDQWALIPTDSGYYQIRNKNSGLDMNVSGASTNAGALVVQWPFGSGQNDQWMPMSAGNGLNCLINRHSGLALDVPSILPGTQLDQQPYSGAAGQQFNLTGITPGAAPSFSMSASPASQTVIASNSTAFTVTVFTNAGFSGPVTFNVSGLPANAGASFTPPSLSGSGTSILTVTTSNNTPIGVYVLNISGSNAALTNNYGVNLVVSSATAALPGTLVWTGASGTDTNWSTSQNWTNVTVGGYGPPGTNNTLIFTNAAAVTASAPTAPGSGVVNPANISDLVDTSFAIGGLMDFANTASTSPVYHNIGIANGATLTVFTNMQVGGFTQFLFGDNNVTTLTVSGTGATLQITNGGLTVSQDAANGPSNNAVLDLSGLDTLAMNGTQIRVGVEGSGSFHHASGIIYLAKVNTLTLNTAGYSDSANTGSPGSGNPALYIGHNGSAFGNGSQLYLGINNSLFMDYATIGRGDKNALMAFNPAFLNQSPSVYIRGTNGDPTRVGVYVIGDGSAGAQANSAPSTNDFTGGTVDAMINYLCVGRGRSGNNSTVGGSGVLTFNNGTINANTLAVGFTYPSGSNSPAIGVVNVNGSGTLTINSNLFLAQAANVAGQTAFPQATLNLNGGTVEATNIAGGGGTSTINLNSGTLDLQAGNPFAGSLAGISSLSIGAVGAAAGALLENAATISSAGAITIAPNGTLAGDAFISAPGLIVNGTISPGVNGIGATTNSGLTTLGAGGTYVVAVQDATGAPGTGWDFLQANGLLNIQANNGNPFTIELQSFANNAPGNAADFNYATNYDWTIATAVGVITNFSANKFNVDSSQFENDLAGGYFYIRTNGNSLVLSFANNHSPSAGTVTLYRTGSTKAIPVANLASNWSDPDGDPVELAGVNSSSANGVNNVGTDGNFIYYTNANVVADTIFYTVQDVRTNPPAVYQPGDTVLTAVGEIVILPPPPIGNVTINQGALAFSGSGGIPGANYYILASINAALPLGQWTMIATNTFDAYGNFNFTNLADPDSPRLFYLLQLQ